MQAKMNKARYIARRILSQASLHGFANASIYSKILVLLVISGVLIMFFAPFVGSLDESYRSFAEPASIPFEIHTIWKAAVSIFIAILGLIFTSTMIALISRSYDEFVEHVRHGRFKYKGKDHIIFIGMSDKLWSALDAINQRYERYGEVKVVLILLPETASEKDVSHIYARRYSHLNLYVRVGALSSHYTYEQAMAVHANQIISLINNGDTDADGDSTQIKIVTTLTSLIDIKVKSPSILIEVSASKTTKNIVNAICARRGYENLHACDTETLAYKMTGMALLDTRHLKLINNFNNYHTNGIYILPASNWISGPERFRDLVLGFYDSILLGIYDEAEGASGLLCSEHFVIKPDAQLVLMANRVANIRYKKSETNLKISELKLGSVKAIADTLVEHRNRQMLICGDSGVSESLKETLDEVSLKGLDTIPSGTMAEMSAALLAATKNTSYDTILINISNDKQLTFRLYMDMVHSDEGQLSGMVDRAIAIMDDADESIDAIRASTDDYHLMNVDALIGEHIGQACFDFRLDSIYRELVSIEGADLYLIDTDICRPMRDDAELRQTFLTAGIIIVGYITIDGHVVLGDNTLSKIKSVGKSLVVISLGSA